MMNNDREVFHEKMNAYITNREESVDSNVSSRWKECGLVFTTMENSVSDALETKREKRNNIPTHLW